MTMLVVPHTGETFDLSTDLEQLADVFEQLADAEIRIRSVKREISDEVARRLDHEGTRSTEIGPLRFEVNAPSEKQWKLPELQDTLRELVKEGTIAQRKADACIKWEPKAVWAQLKTLLNDPRCKARIEHCFNEVPTTRYAKVRRVG